MVKDASISPSSTPGSLIGSSSTAGSTNFPMTSKSSEIGAAIIKGSGSSSDLSAIDSDEPVFVSSKLKTGDRVKEKGKKRKAEDEAGAGEGKKKAKKAEVVAKSKVKDGEAHGKGIYCHQCHRKQEADTVLRCTRYKMSGKTRRICNTAYCLRDLKVRYDLDPEAIITIGRSGLQDEGGDHDPSSSYIFSCPWCLDDCQCSQCRKKKGLEPLGPSNKPSANTETTPAKPKATTEKKEKIAAVPATFDSGSDLSDLVENQDVQAKTAEEKIKPKVKPKAASAGTTKSNDVASKSKGTPKKVTKDGKAKLLNGSASKPRAKPVKKVEVPVDPPAFEKVDTRLGREEAEQRIQLREYIHRFRPILSVPDRSLGALDDFDRPLTEAGVRLFAGAMLDLVKEDVEGAGDEDLLDTITQHREELRYYADLARFTTIYNILTPLLRLRLPSAIVARDRRAEANASALRAILDLNDNSPAPSWVDIPSGPSRRVGASRLPQPAEVVRMLLAIAERTLPTHKIRAELDSAVGEYDARRKHASQQKAEVGEWDGKKKKLMEAGVRAKSAAETRANKEELKKGQHDHDMRMAMLNFNLRALLSRKSMRHEPLGTDLDGRIYYVLTPRVIDEDARPPFGWASGLLVWGKGVPLKPDAEFDPEALPPNMDRWSHFGKSADVKQLVKWMEYSFKKAVVAAKPVKISTPKKTPNGKLASAVSTVTTPKSPSKANGHSTQTTLTINTPNEMTSIARKPKTPRQSFAVVIPVSARKLAASASESTLSSISAKRSKGDNQDSSDDEGSTSSGLSSLPESETPDFSDLIVPEGYKFSADIIEEQGKELVRKLGEVAEGLAVLEWKGLGEI